MPCQALQQGILSLGCRSRNHHSFSLIVSHEGEEHLPFPALLPAALAKVAMDVHIENVKWK